MTKMLAMLLVLGWSFALRSSVSAAEKPSPPAATTVQTIMQRKMAAMNQVLEGVVTEDFSLVQQHAQGLLDISKVTAWHKVDDELFMSYAKTFQKSAEFMIEQAKAKDLEGIAMGQIRLTLSCLECHNFVRYGRSR